MACFQINCMGQVLVVQELLRRRLLQPGALVANLTSLVRHALCTSLFQQLDVPGAPRGPVNLPRAGPLATLPRPGVSRLLMQSASPSPQQLSTKASMEPGCGQIRLATVDARLRMRLDAVCRWRLSPRTRAAPTTRIAAARSRPTWRPRACRSTSQTRGSRPRFCTRAGVPRPTGALKTQPAGSSLLVV